VIMYRRCENECCLCTVRVIKRSVVVCVSSVSAVACRWFVCVNIETVVVVVDVSSFVMSGGILFVMLIYHLKFQNVNSYFWCASTTFLN
jgi:hypothetical protein